MSPKLIFFTVVSLVWSFSASAEQLYKCVVTNVYQQGETGDFAETDWTALVKDLDEEIIFDSKTGLLRFSGRDDSTEFQVLEAGDQSNSLKAVRILEGPVAMVLETFRVKTFSNYEFVYDEGGLFRTGTCETL